jgi:hypothetical protein
MLIFYTFFGKAFRSFLCSHNIAQMATKKEQKTVHKFVCEICDYTSSKKYDYERHLLTQKHIGNISDTDGNTNLSKVHICDICDKTYKDRTGLWKHKKNCVKKDVKDVNDIMEEKEVNLLVQYLMKENAEFKQLMLDQNKQMVELAKKSAGHHNTNTNNNNTNNNTNNSFNLNFFLNETCKNAMNIMDFVNQLQVGIKDLEETGRLGFAEGISKIFINGLKDIDVSDRPVHCSDSKREVLYIKNNDQWNKEDDNKVILTNAIKHVAHKNMKTINDWTKEHPEFNDADSKQNDRYLKIVSESMSGSSSEETNKNYNKIIKNIARESVIDKMSVALE